LRTFSPVSNGSAPDDDGSPTTIADVTDRAARARAESGRNTPDPQYRILLRERRRSIEMPAQPAESLCLPTATDLAGTAFGFRSSPYPLEHALSAEVPAVINCAPRASRNAYKAVECSANAHSQAPRTPLGLEQQEHKHAQQELPDASSPPLMPHVTETRGSTCSTTSYKMSSPTAAHISPTQAHIQPFLHPMKSAGAGRDETSSLSRSDIWHQGHTLFSSATVGDVIDKLLACKGHTAWLLDSASNPCARITPPFVLKLLLPMINRTANPASAGAAAPLPPTVTPSRAETMGSRSSAGPHSN